MSVVSHQVHRTKLWDERGNETLLREQNDNFQQQMAVMPKDGVSRDDKMLFHLTNEIAYTRDRHVRNWSATTREIVVVEGAACRLGSCRLNCETVQLVEKTSRGLEIPISRTRFLVIVTTFSHSYRLGAGHRHDHIRFDARRTHQQLPTIRF